jgi:antitoxin component of MazEF toxin-antitoxin module
VERTVVLRPRRQLTLPGDVCRALGIQPGDRLVVEVKNEVLIARPQSRVALAALDAIRKAFAESGVSEEQLLESGRQIRDELFAEKYAPWSRANGVVVGGRAAGARRCACSWTPTCSSLGFTLPMARRHAFWRRWPVGKSRQ